MKTYDLIVIGGGSGGIATANRAAEYGAKVAVVEGKQLGGTCVNLGCVPKKATWYASRVDDVLEKYGPGYGFSIEDYSFDYKKFIEKRDAYIGRSRASYTRSFEANSIDLYEGYGQFISDHEVQVGDEVLKGEHFMIATGGRPFLPEIPGIDLASTTDDFFAWEQLPESLLIVGGGYIAVEFAGMLRSLGVQVDVAIRADRILRKFDTMIQDVVEESFEEAGIRLMKNTSIDALKKEDNGQISAFSGSEKISTVDQVIYATGRVPQTDHLGLDQTGVQVTEEGYIKTGPDHQTAVPHIYSVGDVASITSAHLTPVAIKAGRQVSEYLFNQAPTSAISYDLIPSVVFAHPAIGTVGLTEKEAIEAYGEETIKVYRSTFYSMYTSVPEEREACHFKLVTQGPDEKIVGLHGTGEGVDEMIQGFAVALKMGAKKADFDAVVAIHPTGAEEFVTMR